MNRVANKLFQNLSIVLLGFFILFGELIIAHADNPTVQGFDVDVTEVSIIPAEVDPGVYPIIKGYVHNTSSTNSGYGGAATLDVKVVIQYPGGGDYTEWWDNSSFDSDETKNFKKNNEYSINEPGQYTVIYYAYNIDRSHLFSFKSGIFTVIEIPPTGNLKAFSQNENEATIGSKILRLYDSNYYPIGGSVTTNSEGYYQWNGLAVGTYNVELYDSNGDFWGARNASVSNGNTTPLYIQRTFPWFKEIEIIPSTKCIGENIHVEIQVCNGNDYQKNVMVELWVDRDKTANWDYNEEHGPIAIAAGDTGYFGWDFTLQNEGIYYVRAVVKSDPSSSYIPIDTGGWSLTFEVHRCINFSCMNWIVRHETGGPGPNNFSQSINNVWVDDDGLHLKITCEIDTCYCAEVYSKDSLGYGEYTFKINGRIDQLNKNAVLGLFTYQYNGTSETPQEHEIDIEFSPWKEDILPNNAWYVFQYREGGDKNNPNLITPHYFPITLHGDYSTHKFNWTPGKIIFQSYHGHYDQLPSEDYLIAEHEYIDNRVPSADNEKLHMNLWLIDKQLMLSGQQSQEVIIKSVTFTPCATEEFCDGLDNNNDGIVPANEEDADHDGFRVCTGDCNDADPNSYPEAHEFCDGKDNDCDCIIPTNETDADNDWFSICSGDCNDGDSTIYPGASEGCNGIDNDCDGSPAAIEADADKDGFMLCEGDCNDNDSFIYPGAPERADNKDNDCDGKIDESNVIVIRKDNDLKQWLLIHNAPTALKPDIGVEIASYVINPNITRDWSVFSAAAGDFDADRVQEIAVLFQYNNAPYVQCLNIYEAPQVVKNVLPVPLPEPLPVPLPAPIASFKWIGTLNTFYSVTGAVAGDFISGHPGDEIGLLKENAATGGQRIVFYAPPTTLNETLPLETNALATYQWIGSGNGLMIISASSGDYNNDGATEIGFLYQNQNPISPWKGTQLFCFYASPSYGYRCPLPTPIACFSYLGMQNDVSSILGTCGGNFVQTNAGDEFMFMRKNAQGVGNIRIVRPPQTLNAALPAPLAADYDIGKDVVLISGIR